jgi:hypothetical protein
MFFQKSHSEKPGSEEIDTKIERTVAEHINELHEQLDERIQKQIQGDRAFVKDTVGVAFRVAGAAVALVVFFLGALGWKSLAEIQKAMVRAARDKAEAQFVSKDGKQIIDATLDRAVLNSYLIQMALLKTDKAQRLRIEDHDAGRLLRIIKDAETDNVTFESASKIIITALSQEGPGTLRFALVSDICETFAGLIAPKNRDEKWLANNYQKRMWLLNELGETDFSHDLLRVAYRDLLDTNAPLNLRQAAVRNIGKIRDKEALDKLVKWTAEGSDLRVDALVAVAQIDVGNRIIADWISSLDKLPAPSSQDIATVLKVGRAMQDTDRKTGAKLIRFAASHSVLMVNPRSPVRPESGLLRPIFVVPVTNLDDGIAKMQSVPAGVLFQQEGYWTWAVEGLLNELVLRHDLGELRALVSWLTPVDMFEFQHGMPLGSPPPFAVEVTMVQDGAVVLEGGKRLLRSSSKGAVWLWPERWTLDIKEGQRGRTRSTRVRVMESHDNGWEAVGDLSSFENANELRFVVHY